MPYCCLIYLPCVADLRELYAFLCPNSSTTEESTFTAITVWSILTDYVGTLCFRFSGLSQYLLHVGLIFFKEKYRRKVLRKVTGWLQTLHTYPALCQPELNLMLQSRSCRLMQMGRVCCSRPLDISRAIYGPGTSASLMLF